MKSSETIKKYRTMDEKALVKELESLNNELNRSSLKVKANKLANYSLISKTKREIARIQTIINEMSVE